MNHWKIRAIHGKSHEPITGVHEPIAGVYAELIAGRARMGWSYRDDLDLREIVAAASAGRTLTAEQEDAKRCQPFFTDIRVRDVLWYPSIPEKKKVTVVRVTGEYGYDRGIKGVYDSGEDYDFRSFRPCEAVAPSLDVKEGTAVYDWLTRISHTGGCRAVCASLVVVRACFRGRGAWRAFSGRVGAVRRLAVGCVPGCSCVVEGKGENGRVTPRRRIIVGRRYGTRAGRDARRSWRS